MSTKANNEPTEFEAKLAEKAAAEEAAEAEQAEDIEGEEEPVDVELLEPADLALADGRDGGRARPASRGPTRKSGP